MAKVSATASMGVKLKIFSDYENVSPHVSITIEYEVPEDDLAIMANKNDTTIQEELVAEVGRAYKLCRKYVQDEIEVDIASAKTGKDTKYAGKKVT